MADGIESMFRRRRLRQLQGGVAPQRERPGRAYVDPLELGLLAEALFFQKRVAEKEIFGLPERAAQRLVLVAHGVKESQGEGAAGGGVSPCRGTDDGDGAALEKRTGFRLFEGEAALQE